MVGVSCQTVTVLWDFVPVTSVIVTGPIICGPRKERSVKKTQVGEVEILTRLNVGA
jgi:hypothetical protein